MEEVRWCVVVMLLCCHVISIKFVCVLFRWSIVVVVSIHTFLSALWIAPSVLSISISFLLFFFFFSFPFLSIQWGSLDLLVSTHRDSFLALLPPSSLHSLSCVNVRLFRALSPYISIFFSCLCFFFFFVFLLFFCKITTKKWLHVDMWSFLLPLATPIQVPQTPQTLTYPWWPPLQVIPHPLSSFCYPPDPWWPVQQACLLQVKVCCLSYTCNLIIFFVLKRKIAMVG